MDDTLNRLCDRILAHRPGPDGATAIDNLYFAVFDQTTAPIFRLCDPMICVVLQGMKEVAIGSEILRFAPGACFLSTISLPATSAVLKADGQRPYLAISMGLNRDRLATLLAGDAAPPAPDGAKAYGIRQASGALLGALLNLVALLDHPADIAALAPGREYEVLYRLLQSAHGPLLRQAVRSDGATARLAGVIERIRDNPGKPLRVEELANIAGMSVPSFHRHFKALTSSSPRQYQKTLRLQAARRLLVGENDVTRAASRVGYESLAHFSRDYARLFGLPPSRDAARLRVDPGVSAPKVI
ncbi:MAG: AraC family transcriptional regulator N-terminal domain-containing protein [Roseovarius sp.]